MATNSLGMVMFLLYGIGPGQMIHQVMKTQMAVQVTMSLMDLIQMLKVKMMRN